MQSHQLLPLNYVRVAQCRCGPIKLRRSARGISLLGWAHALGMKKARSEPQPPVTAGQPSCAADSESSCQCGGQTQRKHLRHSLSPLRASSGTQSNHWNNCSQTLSLGLEDIAPRNPLRGARPRGQQSVQTKAHPKNDPSTPQAWLPN